MPPTLFFSPLGLHRHSSSALNQAGSAASRPPPSPPPPPLRLSSPPFFPLPSPPVSGPRESAAIPREEEKRRSKFSVEARTNQASLSGAAQCPLPFCHATPEPRPLLSGHRNTICNARATQVTFDTCRYWWQARKRRRRVLVVGYEGWAVIGCSFHGASPLLRILHNSAAACLGLATRPVCASVVRTMCCRLRHSRPLRKPGP